MNEIKVSVNVTVDFSENAKCFFKELFSGNTLKASEAFKSTAQVPAKHEATAPTIEQMAKPVSTAVPATQAETSDLTIDDVRKALSLKVNSHRSKIKDKLNELGAPSVTKLDASKYKEMYDFLNSLS